MAAAAERWLAQLASLAQALGRASLEDDRACTAMINACTAFRVAHAEREYLEQVQPRLDRRHTEEVAAHAAKAVQQVAGRLKAWLDAQGQGGSGGSQLAASSAAKLLTAACDVASASGRLAADANAQLASHVELWQALTAVVQGPGRRLLEAAAAVGNDPGHSAPGRSHMPAGYLAASMICAAGCMLRYMSKTGLLDRSHAGAAFEAAPIHNFLALAGEAVLRWRQEQPDEPLFGDVWDDVFTQYSALLVTAEMVDAATGSTAALGARRGPAGPDLRPEQRRQLLRMVLEGASRALDHLQPEAATEASAAGGAGSGSGGGATAGGGQQRQAAEGGHGKALSLAPETLRALTACRALMPALQLELRGPGVGALLQLLAALLAAIPVEQAQHFRAEEWGLLQLLCIQLPCTCLQLQLDMPAILVDSSGRQVQQAQQPAGDSAAEEPAGDQRQPPANATLQAPVGLWAMQQLPRSLARLRAVAAAECLGGWQLLPLHLAAALQNVSVITRTLARPASGVVAAIPPDQVAAWAAAVADGLRMLPLAERLHAQWQRASGLPAQVHDAARLFAGAMTASLQHCASDAVALLAEADAAAPGPLRPELGALLLPLWQLHTAGCRLVHRTAGSRPAVLGASAAIELACGTSDAARACCVLLRLQLQGPAASDVDAQVTERRLVGVAAAQRAALRTLAPWVQQALVEAGLAGDPTDWAQEIENSWGLGVDLDGVSPDGLAEGAATRSCAWLACPALEGGGGPAAGQGEGSRRCSACRAAWYCGEACSRADWRTGHKRACKHLAALREEAKRAAAAGRRAAAQQQEPAARHRVQGAD